MRDFWLPPRCKGDLRSSEILRSIEEWQFVTGVSEQHMIGPICCIETSVTNHDLSTLRNIREERRRLKPKVLLHSVDTVLLLIFLFVYNRYMATCFDFVPKL